MDTMLAARYVGPNDIQPEQVDMPVPGRGEALLQVQACGFCGSDLNIVAGTHPRAKAPLTIGHEVSCRVVSLDDASSDITVGDHVTVYPLISCGICHACRHGNAHVCRQLRLFGFDVDGGMAEFIKVPTAALMKLPEAMPSSVGALIEPLAVAVHGVGRADLSEVQLTVVLGAGPIGLLTALVARARGVPHVVISDVAAPRLALADSLGLASVHAGDDLLARVMELSHGDGADVVFECAGHPSSAREMTTLVRPRGTIVNLGVFKKPAEVDLQAINFKELSLVGSRVYERRDFKDAIHLAMTLPVSQIVSHAFPLTDVGLAFEQFQSSEACKVLILPSQAAR